MKISEAVFYTDNETVRLETDSGVFYLTNKKKVYDMHPINIMAEEVKKDTSEKVKKAVKDGKYKNKEEVIKWI